MASLEFEYLSKEKNLDEVSYYQLSTSQIGTQSPNSPQDPFEKSQTPIIRVKLG